MKKVFYGLALILAAGLIVLGVMASRKKTPTNSNNGGNSFNADQLPFDSTQGGQDAEQKTPSDY